MAEEFFVNDIEDLTDVGVNDGDVVVGGSVGDGVHDVSPIGYGPVVDG